MSNAPTMTAEMGHYGQMAMRHWEVYLPTMYQRLKSNGTLETKAIQAQENTIRLMEELEMQMMEASPQTERDILKRAAHAKMIQLRAEEVALQKYILLEAENPDLG